MTRNQIEYWRNKEIERNNRAVEIEQNRANLAKEEENRRSNMARERETWRSNLQHENAVRQQMLINLAEVRLNNERRKESNLEINRSNLAHERELAASRRSNEGIQRRKDSIAQYGAYTNRMDTLERRRANVANEWARQFELNEQIRANVARETENTRTNTANEGIRRDQLYAENRRINEQIRSNLARESIQMRGQNLTTLTSLAKIASDQVTNVGRNTVKRRIFQ